MILSLSEVDTLDLEAMSFGGGDLRFTICYLVWEGGQRCDCKLSHSQARSKWMPG